MEIEKEEVIKEETFQDQVNRSFRIKKLFSTWFFLHMKVHVFSMFQLQLLSIVMNGYFVPKYIYTWMFTFYTCFWRM